MRKIMRITIKTTILKEIDNKKNNINKNTKIKRIIKT